MTLILKNYLFFYSTITILLDPQISEADNDLSNF